MDSKAAVETELTEHQDAEMGIETPTTLPADPELKGGFLKPVPETTTVERMAGGIGAVAVLTSLIAIIVEQSIIVTFAGILSAILGPYMYYQETRLTDIKTLQETKAAVQREVDRLIRANQRLIKNVDDLTHSVDRLQEIEQALSVLNDKSGLTVDEFAKQVKENKGLLQKMKGNLKATVLQNLLSVVLRSDADRNMVIQEEEVNDLIRRIQNISGVRVDEARFRAACHGETVHAVMDMIKNLLRADVAEEEQIFIFDH